MWRRGCGSVGARTALSRFVVLSESPAARITAASLEAEVHVRRAAWVEHSYPSEEIAVSESTKDRPDEVDEKAPKPGEPDTETVAGQPLKAPAHKDGEQSKQDE
jgi:hypothetical protein